MDKKNLDLPKLVIYYAFPVLNPYNKTVTVLKAPKTEATERFSKAQQSFDWKTWPFENDAGGWAEPNMVIRYSKTYNKNQVDIVEQMEEGYLKTGYTKPSPDTEKLLRIIQDNPELVIKLLASVK